MIGKQKLIRLREDCVRVEAGSILLYTRYPDNSGIFDAFPADDRERLGRYPVPEVLILCALLSHTRKTLNALLGFSPGTFGRVRSPRIFHAGAEFRLSCRQDSSGSGAISIAVVTCSPSWKRLKRRRGEGVATCSMPGRLWARNQGSVAAGLCGAMARI